MKLLYYNCLRQRFANLLAIVQQHCKLLILIASWICPVANASCPNRCSCLYEKGRFTTDCTNSYRQDPGFTDIPTGIPAKTMILRMDNNNLSNLKERRYFAKLGLENVLELSLSNCSIRMVRSHSFADLTHLRKLILSHNHIRQLAENNFKELVTLEHLDLSYNSLKELPSQAFTGALNLRRIYLGHNSISYIYPDSFKGLMLLELVDLAGNNFDRIFVDPFVKLSSLRTLSLVNNKWNCNCFLRPFVAWLYYKEDKTEISARKRFLTEPPLCVLPEKHRGKSWDILDLEEFACEPIIVDKNQAAPLTIQAGNTLTLPCQATGDPRPSIRWEFHGNRSHSGLSTNSRTTISMFTTSEGTQSELRLKDINSLDTGQYHCLAANRLATDYVVFQVQVDTPGSGEVGDSALTEANETGGVRRISTDLLVIIIIIIGALLVIFLLIMAVILFRKRTHAQPQIYSHMNGHNYKYLPNGGPNPVEKPTRTYEQGAVAVPPAIQANNSYSPWYDTPVHIAALEKERQCGLLHAYHPQYTPAQYEVTYIPAQDTLAADDSGYLEPDVHSGRASSALPSSRDIRASPQPFTHSHSPSPNSRCTHRSGTAPLADVDMESTSTEGAQGVQAARQVSTNLRETAL